MSNFGLVLPLRIEVAEESVSVVDAAGVRAFYVYTCAEPERRRNTNRLSPEDGVAVAKIAARALTDQMERG
ncbi:hypothetical protein AFCDBAGC_1871 [Methylobacterium cerastii]|uniref:Uncharacterized protein n=1 Tax=Methylobacterium cerastii TaxID=932741 RepID=A0ABQ4QFH9_9HYPH|nr:hypothetical protein [Methylobacterium cerastii]GJD44009.1 hypothetical protein AFCDBAGC_1871 [Methylobacterium cerastii]